MRRKSGWRVPIGWALGVLGLYLASPSPWSVLIGSPLILAGEALRLWASGHIDKTRALATGGPYAHTRNPLYLGSLLMALGVLIAAASPWIAFGAVLYAAFFYPSVILEESSFLRQKFGEDYERWSSAVPAFLPRLSPGGPRTSRFSWQQIRVNREWRTAAALPLIALILLGRWWLALPR